MSIGESCIIETWPGITLWNRALPKWWGPAILWFGYVLLSVRKLSDLCGQQSLYWGCRPETPPSWISSTIPLPHCLRSLRNRKQLAPQYEPGIRLCAKTACLF